MRENKPRFFGTGPVLPVPNIELTIDYYVKTLGFTRDFGEETHPGHGSVTRDRVGVQFTRSSGEFEVQSYPGWFYFFVENIDSLYEAYQAAGAKFKRPVESHPHGMREFEIEDINGYRLRFGQRLQ